MDFLQLATDRYSVRSFSDRPIEPEKMEKILKAGQLAPTAVNFQPQKIYILKSKAALDKIRSLTRFAYDAPVVLLFCADISKAWKSPVEHGYNTGEMDVSIVCTHMMLEAWELGIGSVWVRGFDARQVAKAFDLPGIPTITLYVGLKVFISNSQDAFSTLSVFIAYILTSW